MKYARCWSFEDWSIEILAYEKFWGIEVLEVLRYEKYWDIEVLEVLKKRSIKDEKYGSMEVLKMRSIKDEKY